MSVLDLGCGALKRGDVGIDIERTGKVDIVADVHFLPIRDSLFKGCVAYAVLEHVEKPSLVVKEINRVLIENGYLKIRVPRDSRLRFDTFMFFGFLHFDQLKQQYSFLKSGGHKWQYSVKSLKKLLEKNGFSVSVVTFTGLHREARNRLLVNVFEYLRNIYILAHKTY